MTVLHHDEAHQDVSHHAQQEDEKVGQDVAGGHEEGVLVVGRDGDVGDIRQALQAGVQAGCQDDLQLRRLIAGAVLRLHPVGDWALRWGEKRWFRFHRRLLVTVLRVFRLGGQLTERNAEPC